MLPLPILNVRLNACHEDWQQMTPVVLGRHCAQCNRVVLDFTASTQADLAAAFQNSPDGRVCGRFWPEQLAPRPLLRQKLRRFLVALVLVCGLGLSGQEALAQVRKAGHAKAHQHPKPVKQNTPAVLLGDVEELPVKTTEQGIVLEDLNPETPATLVPEPAQAPRLSTRPQLLPTLGSQVVQPAYKAGGLAGIQQVISQNLRWPNPVKEVEGNVLVSFIIDTTGKIRNARVITSLEPEFDAEALRVTGLLGGFDPARQNGQPIEMEYTLPIFFRIQQKL